MIIIGIFIVILSVYGAIGFSIFKDCKKWLLLWPLFLILGGVLIGIDVKIEVKEKIYPWFIVTGKQKEYKILN
jgi:heme A synthase